MLTGNAGDAQRRRAHYRVFYGLEAPARDAPLVIVHGNCQAESLRLALECDDVVTVRVPAVHELTPADLARLHALVAQAAVLVSQPVRDGYRGLELGTAELRRHLPVDAVCVVVPVIRYCGIYPSQAIVRPPADRSLTPPLVPYHDLTVLARAAGRPVARAPGPEAVRAIAAHSLGELRRREAAHGTVVISDLFERPDFAQMRTINHPGNPIWETLSRRVRAALGLGAAPPLTRPLLNAVHAPRAPEVIEAFGLDVVPEPAWTVDGVQVDPDALLRVHLDWYRAHPDAVTEGLRRHAEVLELLAPG